MSLNRLDYSDDESWEAALRSLDEKPLTVWEKHQKLLKEENDRHLQAKAKLINALKTEQKTCSHEWGEVDKHMFYALGECAPGRQCKKCGLQKHE